MNTSKQASRIAGLLYLIIIAAGIFAHFVVRGGLKVPGDAAASAVNIAGSQFLFRLGITADLLMILSDVALAMLFFELLKPVSRKLSLLAAFFRLGQATILGLNLVNLFLVLHLVGESSLVAPIGVDQRRALAYMFLEAHEIGYALGLALFAASILILGYLVYKSGYLPRLLGVGLMVAGVGYLIDTGARVLLADYAAFADILGVIVFAPAVVAELSFALWLLLRGVSVLSANAVAPSASALRQAARG